MPESEYHKKIKELVYQKLSEWFGASIPEYYDEAHELDVYSVTSDGLSIYVEVIFDSSKGHFRDDLLIIQRSDADLIFAIVSPEILKKSDRVKEFQKTQISKRKSGIKMSPMINGDRILSDPNYVDFEFKQLVESYLLEKRQENKPKEPDLQVFLLDENEKPCLELTVKPLYVNEKVLKKKASTTFEKLQKAQNELQNLIPINVLLSNDGSKGAENIHIFLEFPPDCELLTEHDARGGIALLTTQNGYAGFSINDKNNAVATKDHLGNDLVFYNFSPIYVRFPAKENDVKLQISICQEGFPRKDIDAVIHVQPKFKEVTKTVWID